jgi:hypothetical protein
MATRVTFVGTREELVQQAELLAAMLTGTKPDTHNIGLMFLSSIGMAALADIHMAFLIKAGGGTDDTGDKWPPLAPSTIAGRRVGPRDSLVAREWTKVRNREYKKLQNQFKKHEGDLYERFLVSLDPASARQRAKTIAAIRAREHTGLTKLQALGGRNVEILRDTGILLNSLSPGIRSSGGSYSKPSGDGGSDQMFELLSGTVIVGTNTSYAAAHQTGSKHLPQRKIVPEGESDIPEEWWDRWLGAAVKSIEATAALLFGNP